MIGKFPIAGETKKFKTSSVVQIVTSGEFLASCSTQELGEMIDAMDLERNWRENRRAIND